ncbi:MAG: hypothetical protein J6Q41_05325, partial [Firmicutes bacterium]|nr:hypothetical protein [Bacillota bacterium]
NEDPNAMTEEGMEDFDGESMEGMEGMEDFEGETMDGMEGESMESAEDEFMEIPEGSEDGGDN